jgi:hypothetical protein
MFEFTRQEDGDQNFVDSPLNENDTNQTKHCVGSIPKFQEPLYCVSLVNNNLGNSEQNALGIRKSRPFQSILECGRWMP